MYSSSLQFVLSNMLVHSLDSIFGDWNEIHLNCLLRAGHVHVCYALNTCQNFS